MLPPITAPENSASRAEKEPEDPFQSAVERSHSGHAGAGDGGRGSPGGGGRPWARAQGFEVDVAPTGPDGLCRPGEGAYAAIVLYVLLPGVYGYLLCRRARHERVTTPILMLTAKQGEHDEAEGLDLGADDFLRKPFSFLVLVARLRP